MFYDCVIVGAGAVGASLALVLGQLNYRVLLLEKNNLQKNSPKDDFAASTLGLSFVSSCIYSTLGVWQKLVSQSVPIQRVDVSVKDHFGGTQLGAHKGEALGFVVSMQHLEVTLYEELVSNKTVDILQNATLLHYENTVDGWNLDVSSSLETKKLTCRLLVGADGANSQLRKAQQIPSTTRDYRHYAMMTNVRLNPSLGCTAIERFLKNGAFALLPWKENIATCVWTIDEKESQEVVKYSDEKYQAACQQQLGRRYGQIVEIGKRRCLPLQMQLSQQQSSARFLLMGNAAHSLHPIAAQGFNLSLRDIWQLRMQILKTAKAIDLGDKAFLNEYVEARQMDQRRVVFATDKIARYMSGGPLPSWLRAMGITLFDCMPPVKSLFTRYSMGLSG